MQTEELDGRICLDRDVLKKLRRKLGVSQEKVAFLCAEQGLCVSIASIKRAETNKNILYRTARDIARFYDVEVNSLLSSDYSSSGSSSTAISPQSSVSALDDNISFRRKIILLTVQCCLTRDQQQEEPDVEYVTNLIRNELSYFDGEVVNPYKSGVLLAFGVRGNNGKAALKALHCARMLKNKFEVESKHKNVAQFFLSIANTVEYPAANEGEQGHAERFGIAEKHVDEHKNIFNLCSASKIYVSDGLKKALEGECQFVKDDAMASQCWALECEHESNSLPQANKIPLVGRKLELLQFKLVLESALEYEQAQLVTLQAPAGTGKSRLLYEFCQLGNTFGFSASFFYIFDFASEQHQKTLSLLVEWLVCEFFSSKNKDVLLPLLLSEGVCDNEDLVHVYTWLDWPLPVELRCVLENLTQEQRENRQARVLVKLISLACNTSPLLICIEDLHWADDDVIRVFEQVFSMLDNQKLVLVLTGRPEGSAKQLFANHSWQMPNLAINLSPLVHSEAVLLAHHITPNALNHADLCVQRSEGNPLFLVQLLLQKRPVIGGEAEGGAASDYSDTPNVEVPYSIYELIQDKIAQLDDCNRRVLFIAAVMGKNIQFDMLCELAGVTHYYPHALIDAGILVQQKDNYVFSHALIQEGIYRAIVNSVRESLHLKCALWYSDKNCVQYAYHMLYAKHVDAPECIYQAVSYLVSRCQFEAAQNFVNYALNIRYVSFDKSKFYLKEGEILVKTGNMERALSYFERASASPNVTVGIQALVEQASCLNTLDQFSKAVRVLNRAEALAEDWGDHSMLAKINSLRGNFYFPKGDVARCFEYHQASLTHAQLCGDRILQAKALGGLGDAAYAQGQMLSAEEYFSRCLALCNSEDYLSVKAAYLYMLATVKIYLNKTQSALEDALHAVVLAQKIGHKRAEIVARLTASWVYIDKLDVPQAQAQIQKGLELAEEIGAKRFEPFLLEGLARLHYWSGNTEKALSTSTKAVNMMESLGAQTFIGPWVLSTQALCSYKSEDALATLSKGEELLNEGCIGHNYYRFYVHAIEVCLVHENVDEAKRYITLLKKYTKNEPTPWSVFYIKRAIYRLNGQEEAVMQELKLWIIEQAKSADLKSALLQFNALSDVAAH